MVFFSIMPSRTEGFGLIGLEALLLADTKDDLYENQTHSAREEHRSQPLSGYVNHYMQEHQQVVQDPPSDIISHRYFEQQNSNYAMFTNEQLTNIFFIKHETRIIINTRTG